MLRQYFLGMIQHQKEPAQDFSKPFIVWTLHAWIVFCSNSHFTPPQLFPYHYCIDYVKFMYSFKKFRVCSVCMSHLKEHPWPHRGQLAENWLFLIQKTSSATPNSKPGFWLVWFFIQVLPTQSPPLWLVCCNQKTFFFAAFSPSLRLTTFFAPFSAMTPGPWNMRCGIGVPFKAFHIVVTYLLCIYQIYFLF